MNIQYRYICIIIDTLLSAKLSARLGVTMLSALFLNSLLGFATKHKRGIIRTEFLHTFT